MSRPPVQTCLWKAAGALLLVFGLTFLVGCQGLSAAGNQPPDGSLAIGTGNMNFGNVAAGNSKTVTVTAMNSESQSVTISSASVSTKYFSLTSPSLPLTIGAGQSTTISFKFSPDAAGLFNATVSVVSDASNGTVDLALSGTGTASGIGQLGLSPANEAFGSVIVGGQQSQTVNLTNLGEAPVTISDASISGPGFQLSGITTPLTLSVAQSTTFTVVFAPQTTGTVSGTVTITSDASNSPLTMSLTGTGIALGSLGSNPSSLSFGNVQVGVKQTQSETVTNTGGSSVTISQAAVNGTGFSLTGITTPVTLAAGQSTTFSVSFTPPSAGAATGNVTITSTASNATLTVPLSGTGIAPGALSSNPTSLGFGSVQVGTKQTLSETVKNTGGTSVTISQVGASGSGFSVTGITAPVTLVAGQSATFSVSFTPPVAGAASGSVTITSNGSNPTLTIPLSGTGIAAGSLASNPTILSFGSVQVGVKQTLSETVTNSGGSSVTISQVGISGSGFTVSGITAPVTLTAGQSATFSVSFTPPAAGAASGNVTITSNASNPTLTIPISGAGIAAGALGANPTNLSFGSVQVGVKTTLSETVTNIGGSSVTISQVGVSGTGFSVSGITAPVTLTAGQSATFSVSFTPPSAGAASGNVTITSNASNPTLTIPLSGTGIAAGALGANPTSLSFGNVQVGNNRSLSETVTNTGGSSVTISQVGISGSDFTVSGITAPVTLPAGQSVTFSVKFTPVSTSSVTGTVTITSNASNPTLTIPLSGTGTGATGQLTVNPTALNLGSVIAGESGTASGSLTASGGSVTVTAATSNNSVFSVGGLGLPVTIPAGQSASFTVTFSPLTTGVANATLTFTSNALPSTTTEALTGIGTPAPVHTVNLSWNASTSPNISGYNIYRALYVNSCGSFSKINSTLNTGLLYTDPAVVDGASYCYATTAVDTSNAESGYSNIVSNLQIPPP